MMQECLACEYKTRYSPWQEYRIICPLCGEQLINNDEDIIIKHFNEKTDNIIRDDKELLDELGKK